MLSCVSLVRNPIWIYSICFFVLVSREILFGNIVYVLLCLSRGESYLDI